MLLVSHEEELLRRLADEVWWLQDGRLAGRGDPEEMLARIARHIAATLRAWGDEHHAAARAARPPRRRPRRGGRVETVGEDGRPTMVWRSGELAVVRVTVRFRDAVADPVVGMMIRTRIGLNVYGTNTELEKLEAGPVRGGRNAGGRASPSAASCARRSTPSRWLRTIPTAFGTTGWRMPSRFRSATPATPPAWRICGQWRRYPVSLVPPIAAPFGNLGGAPCCRAYPAFIGRRALGWR